MINLPNFLIVGAAKCGTTSMSEYLKQHPQIFISEVKEPRFLSSQITSFPLTGPGDAKRESRYIKDFKSYCELFRSANGHVAIGEASADTLYFHHKTIPVIKKYIGDQPKIVIMLRDPVKRAFSAYQHLVRDQRETLSFEEGLRSEASRIQENYELIWYYRGVSQYLEAIQSFMKNFEQVHVVINEDFQTNPVRVFQNIFEFLEVDPAFCIDTSIRYNVSGVPRSQWLHNFLFEENWLKRAVRPITYRITSNKFRQQTSSKLLNRNLQRMRINSETENQLKQEFRGEKLKIEELLNRNLPWLAN
jgi:hypothetical protein